MADPTDQEIFASASVADESAPQPEPSTTSSPEPAPEPGAPPRDPATGQFAPKAGDSEPQSAPSPEPQPQPQQHHVPLAEHLSEREKRQLAEREREDFRRQLEAMRAELAELRRPKGEPPDLYAQPDQYFDQRLKPLADGQEAIVERFSKLFAVQQFGKDAVDAAYSALEAEVMRDPRMALEARRIWQAEHPYGELIAWHKSRKALEEFGTDPAAYKAKVREELAKDPEFIKQVIEATRIAAGGAPAAQQQPGARPPSTVIQLPPSLGSRTAAAPNAPAGGEDAISEQELFRLAATG